MILNAMINPQRLPRAFREWTRLEFQVRVPSTVTLAKEQGEAQNPNDGVQITQTNTSPPWAEWWIGDLWYASNVDNTQFVVLNIGEATPNFHP
jgi:hypothetical protein